MKFQKSSLIKTITLLLAALFCSCGSILEPQLAECSGVKSYIYKNVTNRMADTWFTAEANPSHDYDEPEINNVKMIDWYLDEETQGGSYTGYLVIYEIQGEKHTYYALANLIEFDEEGKYQVQLLNSSRSLAEVKRDVIED